MKKKLFLVYFIFVIFMLSACNQNGNTKEKLHFSNIRAPKFSGYVCGYKGKETFLQLPIFLPVNDNISIDDINKIVLKGSEEEFLCNNYNLSTFTQTKDKSYKLSTLSFRVSLAKEGKFSVNEVVLYLSDDTCVSIELGQVEINIFDNEQPKEEYLSMHQFLINQSEQTTLKVCYVNKTDKNIKIENFSYPTDVCSGIDINKFEDFDLSKPEDGLSIPPYSERTFVVHFNFEQNFINGKGRFFYILPMVIYSIDNIQIEIPAQTQATIIQTPFNELVIKEIVDK